QKSSSSTSYVPPSRNDWDLLFQPLFDELLNPTPSVDNQDAEVIAPIAEVIPQVDDDSTGSPSSTTVDQDAPSPSKSPTPTETQSSAILQDVGNDNLDIKVAHMENDPLLGVPITEVASGQSSSMTSPQSIVQPNHPMTHHNSKWTKDHPLDYIIEIQSSVILQDVRNDNLVIEVAHMGNDPLLGVPITEVAFGQSSSTASPQSNVQPNHPMTHYNSKWTKDHPPNYIIGPLSRPVSTQLQLHEQALFCYYDAFLTLVEPKTYKEASTQACWIEAMQEELYEFKHLEEEYSRTRLVWLPVVIARRKGLIFKSRLLRQSKYALESLKKYGFESCDPVDTPMVEKSKLDEDREGKAVDPLHYRGIIGTLLYLTASRHDLQFAICMCAR
nr:uncharacterized mitochondrial protein AtMg00810-like [Tanacetum cinerariifolium]